MTDTPTAAEALDRRATAELGACCEELRAIVRMVTERRRMAALVVTPGWLGPARDRFDQRMAELDRDSADLDIRLSALIAQLGEP